MRVGGLEHCQTRRNHRELVEGWPLAPEEKERNDRWHSSTRREEEGGREGGREREHERKRGGIYSATGIINNILSATIFSNRSWFISWLRINSKRLLQIGIFSKVNYFDC